eukprot:3680343-Pyramimonas_sp.AAC.1
MRALPRYGGRPGRRGRRPHLRRADGEPVQLAAEDAMLIVVDSAVTEGDEIVTLLTTTEIGNIPVHRDLPNII